MNETSVLWEETIRGGWRNYLASSNLWIAAIQRFNQNEGALALRFRGMSRSIPGRASVLRAHRIMLYSLSLFFLLAIPARLIHFIATLAWLLGPVGVGSIVALRCCQLGNHWEEFCELRSVCWFRVTSHQQMWRTPFSWHPVDEPLAAKAQSLKAGI
jgi:hypothetical protein